MMMRKKVINRLRKWGWELKRYNIRNSESALMQKVINHYSVDLVIDVGANMGQYSLELISGGYMGPILSFEPIQQAFDQLQAESRAFPQWQAFHMGVGNSSQELEMNISDNLVSSSLLNITQVTLQAEPTTRYNRKEKVKIITLDSFLKDKSLETYHMPLLKLDVQGYELEVLKGASASLPKIKLVQAELSFVPLYEGGPLYKEFLLFMEENNFEIYTIIPGFRDPFSGRMLQADGIFINKNLLTP